MSLVYWRPRGPSTRLAGLHGYDILRTTFVFFISMEHSVQEIFDRVEKNRARMKELRTMYKDALAGTQEYTELNDKIKTLRERKKQIENTIRENFTKEATELEDLKVDMDSDMEMLSDIALTRLVKGEQVEVTDKYQNQYEPVFTVKFRKAK